MKGYKEIFFVQYHYITTIAIKKTYSLIVTNYFRQKMDFAIWKYYANIKMWHTQIASYYNKHKKLGT